MAKTPCRQCDKCNLYHNLAVEVCDCGNDLKRRPVVLMEENEIPGERLGDFDTPVVVYVQKCSYCGKLNYSTDKQEPVKSCYNCGKTRVAGAPRTEYKPEAENEEKRPQEKKCDEGKPLVRMEQPQMKALTPTPASDSQEEEEDLSGEAAFWLNGLQKNIRNASSASYGYVPEEEEPAEEIPETRKQAPSPSGGKGNVTAEEEEEEEVSWGDIGLKDGKESSPTPPKKAVTLTAIRYGRLTFTVEAEQGEYMLGRSAMQGEFLEADLRVGNEHCYLIYKNGNWYVKDNYSRNGTAVNGEDIGEGGERVLRDGDLLKLGHHGDSMEFLVTIG